MNNIINYIIERNNIYIKKELNNEKAPWTNDITLQKYKFCNIYRQLDKCSRYELEYIKNNNNHLKQLHFILLFRLVITIDIMELLLTNPTREDFYKLYKENNYKLNNAIIFHTPKGKKAYESIYDYYEYLNNNIEDIYENIITFTNPNKLLKYISKTLKSIGPFKAYEIYTSLTYTDIINFTDNDIIHIGPGSKKTLDDLNTDLITFKNNLKIELDKLDFKYIYPLTNRVCEDLCCEYRKYINLKTNPKKYKKRYYK